jgi:hypothetical protein
MQGIAPATKQFDLTLDMTREQRLDTTVPMALGIGLVPETTTSFLPPITDWTPRRSNRRASVLTRINRLLRTVLVTFCGVTLLGYGLDVAASSEVAKLQEQARRLSEQNTELSAQLLRAISFQGIQANVVGHAGLRVPEHVIIVKEVQPPTVPSFQPNKYYLPLGAVGY